MVEGKPKFSQIIRG